jgi:hypothetical protein
MRRSSPVHGDWSRDEEGAGGQHHHGTWHLHAITGPSTVVATSGYEPDLEAAKVAIAENWGRWLALAKHIVDMAKQGERDRSRLIEGALARLRL